MSRRRPCPAAPGPLEGLCGPGLMTCSGRGAAAGVPGVPGRAAGAAGPEQDADGAGRGRAGRGAASGGAAVAVFLSESRWDAEKVIGRRLELLFADPATAPHGGGVLVIDDSGDRKDATKTAHVGHQWLGRHGKIDNGVVTVITLWADERLYYSLYAVPTPRPGTSRKGRAIRRSAPSCAQCGRQPDDLAKNLCLASLRDRNEVLFCRLLTDHTERC
jgi:hypothetical protein